jgi:hypothetical protein
LSANEELVFAAEIFRQRPNFSIDVAENISHELETLFLKTLLTFETEAFT